MTTKSKTAKKVAGGTTKATAKKAVPKKKETAKAPAPPAIDTTPVTDPCAVGHTWETDADGVEHCTVCLADRKVIEGTEGTKAGRPEKEATSTKPAKAKKAKTTATKTTTATTMTTETTKLSALDAAAQVLASSTEPLNAKQMIEQMAAKGLWTSPGGKTPHATLYSAILREVQVKGKESRFRKTERGHFKANG